jgi:putative addiction module killer protein
MLQIRMTEVYRDWINALRDRQARARIQVRIERLANGHAGRHRRLSVGICELKIDFGPGYRVYDTERRGELIILLAGGDKGSQRNDIETAILLARGL